jgi:hypothetical protein
MTEILIKPPTPNGSSSIPISSTYTSNLGIAFKAGLTTKISHIQLELTSSAASSNISFKIALHNTNNSTPYEAVAGSTVYGVDTITVTTPSTANTPFTVRLDSSQIPNISNYTLIKDQAYALILYNAIGSIALRRTQGLANGTTNDAYTVSNGFVMLDTFRNNTANYTNSSGSYVAFTIQIEKEITASPKVVPTLTLTTNPTGDQSYGTPIEFIAEVSFFGGPVVSGNVEFKDETSSVISLGTEPVVNGFANLTVSTLSAGISKVIKAYYTP